MMKKFLNIFSLLWLAGHSYAQTLNATTAENYVYTKSCLDADCIKKTEAIQYFDGLGRAKQTIGIKATPSGKDIVNHVEYDAFGRVAKEYLPIPQNTTQNGAFYTAPLSNAPTVFGQEKIYSEKQFENSPLGRINKITPLGNDWAQHPVQMGYSANIAGEVKKYTVINSWVDEATYSKLVESGTYGANQLMKTTVIDSDNNTSVEFKNAAGQTILLRKNDGAKDVDTYYVYNDLGMQVFVITPLAATTTVDGNALDNLCYQYRYDSLGRLVEKKLPGKDWEYMVYDKADRLILSRDTNMKQNNQWLMTKYDELGRPVYTGFLTGGDRAARQNDLKNLIITEKRDATGFFRSATNIYYTENYFSGETPVILSINYYDTYPQGTPPKPATIFGQDIIWDNTYAFQNTKTLPTASYVKNIDDDYWTYNWIWYDSKLRAVGNHSINHLGGYTKIETKLDFAGVAVQSKAYHKRLQTDPERTISQIFEYDDHNRLLVQKHQVDNNPIEILSQNEYNEQSQLKRKKVGGTDTANPLQSIDYKYNIRGWVTQINDPTNLGNDLFGYKIKYTDPVIGNYPGRFNGNIAEVDWKAATDGQLRRYNYSYDRLNRLVHAIYLKPNASVVQTSAYNEWVDYDINGNITRLDRYGDSDGNGPLQIDRLYYTYSGNRLSKVEDTTQNPSGYPYVPSPNTIAYDDNGNMTSHMDKGISSIQYNYLNLPEKITQNSKVTDYIYRADGVKVKKIFDTKATDYLDGFQYENSTLKFFPTTEGYFNVETGKYVYNYTDHLGNTRLSYTKNGAGTEIIEESNYYPFGLKHEGYNVLSGNLAYKYKYNGKELQESGMYDYGARMYMPDLGRWGVTDPLAEVFRRFSPYHYGADNPVMFTDPDGMRNKPYEGGLEINVPDGSWWFAGGSGNFTSGYVENNWIGKRTGGGATATFGETQAYKDIMAYLNDPGTNYFKEIDFSHFADGLKIISRQEWGAKNPIKKGRSWESLPINLSAYYNTITIHHSGNAKNYMTIQELQDKEQGDGYADIPYHFAIDSQGNIYEGRPIYIKGAHTAGANTSNIGIVLMSDLDYQNKGLSFEKFLYENYINGNGGASTKMRESLTNLVSYLNTQYGIQYLGGHIEKINETRYCPGDGGMKIVNYLRQKFNMQVPIKQ
ncbi:DUF6443 domain-containing protein [Chryseobacterium sp. KCF3-3]|uniref:DUF6443 domain-containing protein n=1 Tax=Chryseobacterium sp. KCF3-3 TaxID=3231511 RepID=UPI0038B24D83